MTEAHAGPSLRSVVMSLKRMPSVGKSLMSRIFALRSAMCMAPAILPDAAMRQTPMCPTSVAARHRLPPERKAVDGLPRSPGDAQKPDFPAGDPESGSAGTHLAYPR